NGVPSIGLLQVIKPTFDAYHVPGTKNDQYDPVANITAACNYAAARYGSIDNVNGPY
ncbi:transglycosylase SLT domain-containing protein, partial [Streptomyces purpureus]